MNYQNIFDQFYNELSDIPDFPTEKAEKLWAALPPLSRELAGMIYLLPFGEKAEEKEHSYARILSLVSLSAFIHGDLEKNKAFSDKEAVLYGDYLFALAFSLLPADISAEEAKELLAMTYHFGENRLAHEKEISSEADEILFAREDYGLPLRRTAEKAMDKSGAEGETKEAYATYAEKVGTAWGILCENYRTSPLPCLKEAAAIAATVPMPEGMKQIIQLLKGAAIDHDQNLS